MPHIDLSPLFPYVNETIVLVATGVAAWLVQELRAWLQKHTAFLSAQTDNAIAAGLNTALKNGVTLALNQMQAWETAHKDVQVQGAVTRIAAQYALDHAPEYAAHFGLSPDDLATKALAFLPPPPSIQVAPPAPVMPVEVKPLPPV